MKIKIPRDLPGPSTPLEHCCDIAGNVFILTLLGVIGIIGILIGIMTED